ncbi:MAG: Glutamate--tRNA ligase mitochondrial [Alyxoria varia]|nr:MAG: Glutamate--tRNA ligase mitochondrial [Alyxoria varia]
MPSYTEDMLTAIQAHNKRLAQLAQDRRRLGLPTDYDRQCASIPREESDFRAANGESHVVRLRAPEKYPVFTDIVYGIVGRHDTGPNVGVTHKHGEIAYEDPVLLKSDGEPTYHLANVVDDHHMEITHVIRATEWLSSTPKHLALYDAFGWKPPEFCHVGLLVDEKGRKLSKRNVDVDLASFRKKGYFKDALVNFTALLGRSIPRRSEVVDMRELIGSFDQLKFTKGDQTVTLDKLDFLSRAHLERLLKLDHIPPEVDAIIDSILEACDAGSNRTVPDPMKADERGYVLKLLRMDPRNFKSSTQFFQRNKYLLVKPDQMGPRKSGLPLEPGSASRFDIDSVQTFFESELEVTGVGSHILRSLQHSLALFYVFVQQAQPTEHKQGEKASDIHWNAKDISNQLQAISVLESRYLDSLLKQSSSPLGPRELVPHLRRTVYPHMCKFLRLGLMRGHEGPGVAEAMELIGWEETTWRVRDLINALELYCYPKTGWPSTSHEEMLTFVEVGKRELKFPDTE